jgi:hypothetical protein
MTEETRRVLIYVAHELARWQDIALRKSHAEPDMFAYHQGRAMGHADGLQLMGDVLTLLESGGAPPIVPGPSVSDLT